MRLRVAGRGACLSMGGVDTCLFDASRQFWQAEFLIVSDDEHGFALNHNLLLTLKFTPRATRIQARCLQARRTRLVRSFSWTLTLGRRPQAV